MAEVFLDRMEGEVAVLVLDGRELHLPRSLLPRDAREGEALQLTLTRDPEATARARSRVASKRDERSGGDDGGDVNL